MRIARHALLTGINKTTTPIGCTYYFESRNAVDSNQSVARFENGHTGYSCKVWDAFLSAALMVHWLSPHECRPWRSLGAVDRGDDGRTAAGRTAASDDAPCTAARGLAVSACDVPRRSLCWSRASAWVSALRAPRTAAHAEASFWSSEVKLRDGTCAQQAAP